jgi:hypothetical protein
MPELISRLMAQSRLERCLMSEKQEKALLKATACNAQARHAPSDLLRDKFLRLRDSWIRIANAEEMVSSLTTQVVRRAASSSVSR